MHPVYESYRDHFTVSTDDGRLDVAAIHAALTESYWSPGIPLETVREALRHSLCFGLYEGERQIGFARLVTDWATFAYLADVYVLTEYRGQGLGVWLMECVMAHPVIPKLRRIQLVTRDAQGLYARFGFAPPADPGRALEIVRPGLYQRSTGSESS
jgi:GNAT superfamily N-acetyltransferase